jgi:hypothetical protein
MIVDIYNKIDQLETTLNQIRENMDVLQCDMYESLFPGAKFCVAISIHELNDIISDKQKVKLIQTFDCFCYDDCPKQDKTYIIKSKKPMTNLSIIMELIKQGFTADCNHFFLEGFTEQEGIIDFFMGS